MTLQPPERIVLPAVVLRQARVEDAALLAAAVAANLDHLVPWMPWASAATATVQSQRQRLADVQVRWEQGTAFEYLAVSPATGEHLGNFGLERRAGPGALDIGYWLAGAATGHGYATAAARALTDIALGLPGIERVEIHCDQANRASRRIPERLGYQLDRIVPHEVTAPGESGQRMIWVYPPAVRATSGRADPETTSGARTGPQ